MDRAAAGCGRGIRAPRHGRARAAPAANRGRRSRLSPLRGALRARPSRGARLLPHAGAPAAGRRGRRGAARHGAGGPNQLRPPDGNRPERGPGSPGRRSMRVWVDLGDRGAALRAWRLADSPRPVRTRQTAPLGRRMMRSLTTSVNARRLGQVGVDACLLGLAYYLAYVLRFDSGIPHRYENLLWETIALTVAMKLVIFAMFGLYSKFWRFVDQKDFESILKAVVVSTVGLIVVLFLFSLVLVSGARFAVRAVVERPARGAILERAANEVLIVGAGNGGQQVAFELRR